MVGHEHRVGWASVGRRPGARVTAPTEQARITTNADEPTPDGSASGATSSHGEGPSSRHTPAHLRPHQRWWRIGFPLVLVVLILAIPVLVWAGSRVVLSSSDGRIVQAITDPAAPGWEATVDPTPLMALALVDEAGQLDSVAVLALSGEGSGSVVMVSAATVMGVPGVGSVPLGIVYGTGGADLLREGVQGILGVGLTEIEVVEPSTWAGLVRPVAPLQVSNPDPVSTPNAFGQSEPLFPQGAIDLPASQVWSYLSGRNAGESDLNRLVRVEAFWRAWIAKIAASPDDPGIVPGETESGLGRFVRGLAQGQLDATILPVRPVQLDSGDSVYEPETAEVQGLVVRVVPFPAGPEGARARMTVLDGTGTLDHGLGAAVVFAANGGQIDKVGNAPEFGVTTTQFVYYDDAALSRVERMRDAIGVGEIIKSEELNAAVDVTVVLGEDYVLARPDSSAPVPGLAPSGGGG